MSPAPLKIHVATHHDRRHEYEHALGEGAAARGLHIEMIGAENPEDVDVIIFEPSGPLSDFTPFVNCKLVQSIWAGVDSIIGNPTLTQPLCRMVDAGLAEGMREYVCGHILADHIGLLDYASRATWDDKDWLPLARHVRVGIIGMGTLGRACAQGLRALGFEVEGWTRSGNDGTLCGEKGLEDILGQSDYVVTLLPHTPQTENLINAQSLSHMKPSAMLINPGRGALINEDALLDALDGGKIRKAVLDVFKTEPLPDSHRFWTHERVIVTPHIAAKSRVETACETILENLVRLRDGRDFVFEVERAKGY